MADNNVRIVLQGFADASEATYGAVVYLQCFLHNGAAKVSILASKSRVAPIRVISIPRLELCACVLLAQLVKKIRSTLRLNISDIVLHTDSTIALVWLNTPANRLKTFVANRVAKVQELTEGLQWNHVPSVLNPADLVSRGLRPCDIPNVRKRISVECVVLTPPLRANFLAKGAYVPTPGKGIAPIKYRGVSLDFPALKNAIDRCAVTLRWFRTNETKLSGQSRKSALAFGSKEDAK
ncbi:integrase catalytic domain-containing protein [Trichonephila clavipes]|nr:integrase catalytic domain-containing protein [Trichonephila clavipes]